jgi:hypothetical protein
MVLCIVGIADISSATIITIGIEALANSEDGWYKLSESRFCYNDLFTPETSVSFIGAYSSYSVKCGATLDVDELVSSDDINNTELVRFSIAAEIDSIIWQPDNYGDAAITNTALPTTVPAASYGDYNDAIIEKGNIPLFFEGILN